MNGHRLFARPFCQCRLFRYGACAPQSRSQESSTAEQVARFGAEGRFVGPI